MRRHWGVAIAAAAAVAVAVLASAALIALSGVAPTVAARHMLDYASQPRTLRLITDAATTYFLAGIAVAVGLRVGVFNIGVNGQYILAAVAAGSVVGGMQAPPAVTVLVAIAVAACLGAAWAGIAAWLRVARGVSEVITTIMLNFVAIAIASFVILRTAAGVEVGMNMRGTAPIADTSMLPDIAGQNGFLAIAVLVGVGYWFVMERTRIGFELRAMGMSVEAARISGIRTRRLTALALLASGSVAGIVGLPYLLTDAATYSLTFPREWGWTGIAVALIGRNSSLGVAVAAMVWAFLDIASGQLVLDGVPRQITMVMQGLLVVVAVLGYEGARRRGLNRARASLSDGAQ